MKDATKERVEKETSDWEYLNSLPGEVQGFRLKRLYEIHGDVYDLFCYDNPEAHRSITAYFHEETMEYKLRETLGLIEFCRMEYITGDFSSFEKLLREQMPSLLDRIASFREDSMGSILREKNLSQWEYGKSLPAELEGFNLFVKPSEPEEITNGSYVVIDYADFTTESDFAIYYNMFRDEFFGEARICKIPDVSYAFDSNDLRELEEKLSANLGPRLKEIRSRAENLVSQGHPAGS